MRSHRRTCLAREVCGIIYLWLNHPLLSATGKHVGCLRKDLLSRINWIHYLTITSSIKKQTPELLKEDMRSHRRICLPGEVCWTLPEGSFVWFNKRNVVWESPWAIHFVIIICKWAPCLLSRWHFARPPFYLLVSPLSLSSWGKRVLIGLTCFLLKWTKFIAL